MERGATIEAPPAGLGRGLERGGKTRIIRTKTGLWWPAREEEPLEEPLEDPQEEEQTRPSLPPEAFTDQILSQIPSLAGRF